MKKANEVSAYLESISILILGVMLLAFPLVFSTLSTDPFGLPKQLLLGTVTLLLMLLSGAKMISDGAVRLTKTPFDLPVLLFAVALILSAFFAVNRFDAIINIAPVLFAVFAFFLLTNLAKTEPAVIFLTSCTILSGVLTAALSVASYFKVYLLPIQATHVPQFTTLGSLLDQAIYLAALLPIAALLGLRLLKMLGIGTSHGGSRTVGLHEKASYPVAAAYVFSALVILAGLSVTVYQLFTTQKPLLLPFETGFQTAFAAISQDAGRIAQGFLFGSGFGTYATDFTRFKQVAFNSYQNLWNLTFFRSSSFVLELLATTGVVGIAAFLFLVLSLLSDSFAKTKAEIVTRVGNPFVLSLLLLILGAFLLPFSVVITSLFFFIAGLFAATQSLFAPTTRHERYYDVELQFVAFKKGFFPVSMAPVGETHTTKEDKTYIQILPVSFFVLFVLFSGIVGFFLYRYVYSDILYQRSLVAAAAQNQGIQVYNLQNNAINLFPYRDGYYRIYSQVNLALANSIAASTQGGSPSADIQQTVTTLIQQSINAGRRSTQLSPLTTANWQNLSSVYRSLIGFGQNAEQFAILTQQQAVALDPNNPQGYINLGGIYYQLRLWDQAQSQFQLSVNLKPDFANAYYNLGHALEEKGDLQNALLAYQTVKTLVANEKESVKKIDAEIVTVQQKVGTTQEPKAQEQQAAVGNQPPLGIVTPAPTLPTQKRQVEIPGPQSTPTPSVSPTPSPKQ